MSAGGLAPANENAVPMHCVATWDWHVIYWHEVTQETVTKLFPARGFEAGLVSSPDPTLEKGKGSGELGPNLQFSLYR